VSENPGFSLGGGGAEYVDVSDIHGEASDTRDASLSQRDRIMWTIGGALEWIDSNSNANVNSSGRFSPSRVRGQGSRWPDFLLVFAGTVFTVGAKPQTDYMRKWYMALYVSRFVEVNSRLNASNYGVLMGTDTRRDPDSGAAVATYSDAIPSPRTPIRGAPAWR
jgi:hypothetical protein